MKKLVFTSIVLAAAITGYATVASAGTAVLQNADLAKTHFFEFTVPHNFIVQSSQQRYLYLGNGIYRVDATTPIHMTFAFPGENKMLKVESNSGQLMVSMPDHEVALREVAPTVLKQQADLIASDKPALNGKDVKAVVITTTRTNKP